MQNRFAPRASHARSLFVVASMIAYAFVGAPAPASAQDGEVVVLGIRSLEGDDEFARNLTGAVRNSASQVAGWTVSDREVTLAQMSLVHACEEITDACMGEIASSLEAGRVIYGEVRRTSAGDRFDFSLTLHNFNAQTGQLEQSIVESLPGERTDIDDVREPVRRIVSQISGAPQVGRLLVAVNVPGAEVFVDEEAVGTTDENGQLVLEEVAAGTRQVRVTADGHASSRSTVSVEAYGEANFEAQLERGADGGGGIAPELVVGGGLLVVAAASAGLWIWSMTEVNSVQNNQAFIDARNMTPAGNDTCTANRGPVVSDLCQRGTTHEVLQFVFLGVGALSAGLGTYFLLEGLNGDEDDAESASLRISPAFDQNGGYVGLDGRF